MKATTLTGPAAPARTWSLPATAAGTLAAALAAWISPLHPGLSLPAIALAAAGHLALQSRCRSRPPRVRSLAGFLWAPLGRLRRVAADTPLLAAKRHYFIQRVAHRPMVVWVGWWNCRTFPGDPAAIEYFFVERGSTRYAIPAADLVAAS